MQDRHLYEYSIIRVVPSVSREEFINAGVILFCKRRRFIKVLYEVNKAKLTMLCNDFDTEQLLLNLEAFKKIAHGTKDGGPIALMETPERFRWLTAVRSSVIQTSRPHPGLCYDLEEETQRLFEENIL